MKLDDLTCFPLGSKGTFAFRCSQSFGGGCLSWVLLSFFFILMGKGFKVPKRWFPPANGVQTTLVKIKNIFSLVFLFLFLGVVLPFTFLCIPLYMRFLAFQPHNFTISPLDMKLLNQVLIATLNCFVKYFCLNLEPSRMALW